MSFSIRAKEPDAIVAIDIGTTYTKAAYILSTTTTQPSIKPIPILLRPDVQELDPRLLPTTLAYPIGETTSYGIADHKDKSDDSREVYLYFKQQFPDDIVYPESGDHSVQQKSKGRKARELYADFLKILYPIIRRDVSAELAKAGLLWHDARVEFVFSMPVERSTVISETLAEPLSASLEQTMSEKARRVATELVGAACDADFDRYKNHSILHEVYNEAIASSMYSLGNMQKQLNLKKGCNVLVVDIGGGTSDLCLLTTHDDNGTEFDLALIDPMIGEPLGFREVCKRAEEMIGEARNHGFAAQDVAERTVEILRHGLETLAILPKAQIHAATKAPLVSFQEVGRPRIEELRSDTVQQFCHKAIESVIAGDPDRQKRGVRDQIDSVIEDLYCRGTAGGSAWFVPGRKHQVRRPRKNLDVLLISGGFGCTPLVQSLITYCILHDHHGDTVEKVHYNIEGLRIIPSDQPQMCVVYGLIELYRQRQNPPPWQKKMMKSFSGLFSSK